MKLSAMIDYLKLVPLGLKNPKEIVEGIINNVKFENEGLPQDIMEEIVRRRVLCSGCPFMSKNAEIITGHKYNREEQFCTLCSCQIKAKTASLSSGCGAITYNERHPENLQEIKWLPYDNQSKSD